MKKNLTAALLYLLISVAVMFSWFHYGLMYGGGDVGLPAYNPERFLGIILKPWWSETAPGFPRPHSIASIPVQLYFSFLQHIGFQAFMIQAVTFGMLMFLMGFGMYLLACQFLKEKKATAFLAGFFYIINPYMMVAVWHRFIYTTFFFAAALPLLFLLFRIWIKNKKFSALFLFLLINFLFSYMFTTMAYIITLWILLGLYTFFEIFIPWVGRKQGVSIILKAAFALGLWVLINVWWLLPVFFVLPSLVSVQHSVNDTLSTLITIGNQSIIPYSLPGLNYFYLFQNQELENIFSNPLFLFIPWIGVFFIMLGIYFSAKQRKLIFFSLLFVIAVFLAKGSASPLGYFFPFLFEKFFALGVLRNPFEKLGLLIPLSGSILFAIGFSEVTGFFWSRKKVLGKGLIILAFGFYFGVYQWPFWSGTLFGTLEKRNFVKIPDYYQQANDWISSQKESGNILHLPLPSGESSIYRWQYGYSGLDSNIDFFTSNPSIFTIFDLSYLDNALAGFNLMAQYDQSKYSDQIKELFQAFNVRFIVLHRDINWQASKVSSPEKLENILDKLPFLKKQGDFGQLTVYIVNENSYLGKLYLSENSDFVTGQYSLSSLWYLRNSSSPFISGENTAKLDQSTIDSVNIFPEGSLKTSDINSISKDTALQELPSIRILPDSPLYSLIKLKEYIEEKSFQTPEENRELNYAGKRLVEISKILDKKPDYSISPLIQNYLTFLNKGVERILANGTTSNEPAFFILKNIFARHQALLEDINQRVSGQDKVDASHALQLLIQKLVELQIQPEYTLLPDGNNQANNRLVYRYNVPQDGDYEILMTDASVAKLYQNNLNQINLQIDNSVKPRNAQIKDDLISFGNVRLVKGPHEISFTIQTSVNLAVDKQPEEEVISESHNTKEYTVKISPFNPGSSYQISFEYWTKAGTDPIIRTIEDSDPENYSLTDYLNKAHDYQFTAQVDFNGYNKFWKTYSKDIIPRKNASDLSFQIVSTPWDNCSTILADRFLCNKPEIRKSFQQPSDFVVRNIKVNRLLDNLVFLREQDNNKPANVVTNIPFTKVGPLAYEGSITVNKPEYLFFSETFHNNWDLTLDDSHNRFNPENHLFGNMYGNAWFLDKPGKYKFKISFSPEKYLYLGAGVSTFSFIGFLLIWLITKQIKKHEIT